MQIRLLKENKTARLHNIDEAFNHKAISSLILNDLLKVVVIEYNKELIGCLFLEKKMNDYYLYNLKIISKYQNKSLAQTMIKYILKHIKHNIYLKVEKSNDIALHIYEKLGFAVEETIEDYINGIKKFIYVLKYDKERIKINENNINSR